MIIQNHETAFLFDLDDTLYCEHDYVRSGFRAVADHLQQNYPENDLSEAYVTMLEIWSDKGRGKIFDLILERYSISANPLELVRIYREHEPSISLYPDAENVIRYLQNNEIPRGIITDGDKNVQWSKIAALGLKQRFPCIVVTDEWGRDGWKPSPTPYLHAKQFFSNVADHFVYIGDNPNKDFITAKKLGFHTVRIIRDLGDHMQVQVAPEYEADQIIYGLDELLKL